jgi:cation:H+ antiporter
MNLMFQLLILILLAAVTVITVRCLIIRGLNIISERLNFRVKTKGQLLGYATSIPELVAVISAAWAGVFDAGFWNIGASNIINWILLMAAVLFYKQWNDFKSKRLLDEMIFGGLSVICPIALALFFNESGSVPPVWVAVALILFFIVYKVIDKRVNKLDSAESVDQQVNLNQSKAAAEAENPKSNFKNSPGFGVLLLVFGVLAICLCGKFLGQSAGALVNTLKIPGWQVGWILGFVTSVPEMGSFFFIYRQHRQQGKLALTDDSQEALDALVASNMSNLGIILPIGVFVYMLVS